MRRMIAKSINNCHFRSTVHYFAGNMSPQFFFGIRFNLFMEFVIAVLNCSTHSSKFVYPNFHFFSNFPGLLKVISAFIILVKIFLLSFLYRNNRFLFRSGLWR